MQSYSSGFTVLDKLLFASFCYNLGWHGVIWNVVIVKLKEGKCIGWNSTGRPFSCASSVG